MPVLSGKLRIRSSATSFPEGSEDAFGGGHRTEFTTECRLPGGFIIDVREADEGAEDEDRVEATSAE